MIIIFLESSMDDLNALPTTMVIYRVLGIRNNLKGTWKSLQWKMRILPLIPAKENGLLLSHRTGWERLRHGDGTLGSLCIA